MANDFAIQHTREGISIKHVLSNRTLLSFDTRADAELACNAVNQLDAGSSRISSTRWEWLRRYALSAARAALGVKR